MTAQANPSAPLPPGETTSFTGFSSALASSLAAHTSDFVGVIDEDGVALFMNRSVRGADPGDVEGKPLEHFLLPERARRIRAMLDEARSTGRMVMDDAVRIVALDGSERWFVEKCVPVRETDGVVRFILVRTEQTHIRRAQEELRASELRYRTLFESNPDPVVVVELSRLCVVAANPAAARLYGFAKQDLRELEWPALFPPEEREAIRASYRSNPSAERRTTARQTRRDGSTFSAEIVDNPIVYGGVSARVAVVRDRTEHELIEAQLRHAQKMEAMSVLAGGIAHDFNNLLAVISGCADELRDVVEAGSEEEEGLVDLLDAVVRGTNLTKKLMLFCRSLALNSEPVDLVRIIDDLGPILRRMLGDAVDLSVVHEALHATIIGDRTELEQLVSNLVANAGHAATSRGRVVVRTAAVDVVQSQLTRFPRARPGRYVQLSVTDDGHGMDEATLARVFEPFFTTKAHGTGLGLAVVHGVVERHDGFFHAESAPGKGTSIVVYLPLAADALPVARQELATTARAARVLLADDDEVVRKVTARMLRRLGYDVVHAGDGEEALQIFAQSSDSYHFVVLDVMMPRLKGPAAFERMRVLRPALKALFISGFTGEPTLRVLQKPFTVTELEEELQRLLEELPPRLGTPALVDGGPSPG